VYAVAWIFGSRALYPVAIGLLLAVPLAWMWVGLANRPLRVRRHAAERDVLEGEDVHVHIEVEPTGVVPPPALTCVERLGRLGERDVALRPDGRRLAGAYELHGVPRGRYAFEPLLLALEDPFGLCRAEQSQGDHGVLLVYPR